MTSGESTGKAQALLALHAGPGFVLPNAWDAGSARILEQVGFPALATTSAGIAWSCGVPDGGALGRDSMLERVGRIVAAVGVPVTADLEAGYGDTADEVGRTVARAVALGAVGGNLEDAGPDGLFSIDEAADRLEAARAAAPSGTFVLNARTTPTSPVPLETCSPRQSGERPDTSKPAPTAFSCPVSSTRALFAGSPRPSRPHSM
jgi:2-methylisocitrate lyase-like PEP mutase family enzyme